MRIGIEAQRIFRAGKHGMDIVALELIRALQAVDTENEYVIFVKKGPDSGCLAPTANFRIVEVPGLTYADWEQVFLPVWAARYRLDVLHCTSNTAPLLYRGKTALTLHDVIFMESGRAMAGQGSWYQRLGRWYRRLIVPASARRARRVITVSGYEQGVIADTLGLDKSAISVVYNACAPHFSAPPAPVRLREIRAQYGLPMRYLFYIGNTDPKKNIRNTLRAYRNYYVQVPDPLPLVIADVDTALLERLLEELNCKSLAPHIFLTGYVHNQDLPYLYAGASLFLYPSLRESFGIPLLEAMSCGVPVLSSDTSALPEIAGGAALLVNPADDLSISKGMLRLMTDPVLSADCIQRGLARVRDFSWQRSASQLLTVYQSISL